MSGNNKKCVSKEDFEYYIDHEMSWYEYIKLFDEDDDLIIDKLYEALTKKYNIIEK